MLTPFQAGGSLLQSHHTTRASQWFFWNISRCQCNPQTMFLVIARSSASQKSVARSLDNMGSLLGPLPASAWVSGPCSQSLPGKSAPCSWPLPRDQLPALPGYQLPALSLCPGISSMFLVSAWVSAPCFWSLSREQLPALPGISSRFLALPRYQLPGPSLCLGFCSLLCMPGSDPDVLLMLLCGVEGRGPNCSPTGCSELSQQLPELSKVPRESKAPRPALESPVISRFLQGLQLSPPTLTSGALAQRAAALPPTQTSGAIPCSF